MNGRRILFQDPDPRTLRTAERALLATGSEVDVIQAGELGRVEPVAQVAHGALQRFDYASQSVSAPICVADERALLRRITEQRYDLLMLNFDPPQRSHPRWIEVFDHLERSGARVVLHATAASEDYLPLLAERRFVRNLIAKNNEPLEAEELIATTEKLLRGDLFGLEKYLLWGVAPQRFDVVDSRDKRSIVRSAGAIAERLGCNSRVVGLVESIADELFTNAIYNAPRDAAGRPKYASRSRRDPVVLEPAEAAVLEIACDGNYLAIALRDPFGSLTQDTIVGYLNRCLVDRAPLEGGGGAGIGLYRVFQSLSKFIVNIEPGRCTEVISLIDLRLGMRKFRQMSKSFHIFVAKESDRGA